MREVIKDGIKILEKDKIVRMKIATWLKHYTISELAVEVGVSQPTMSKLIKLWGDNMVVIWKNDKVYCVEYSIIRRMYA